MSPPIDEWNDAPPPDDSDFEGDGLKPAIRIVSSQPQSDVQRPEFALTADGKLLRTPHNMAILCERLPELGGCLRYDSFAERHVWARIPSDTSGVHLSVGDSVDKRHAAIAQHIVARRGHGKWTTIDAYMGMLIAADRARVDPLRAWLESLIWDGTSRADTWLREYVGVDDPASIAAGRLWLVSAVARALKPGCQADYCLILQGPQGAYKSRALMTLAGHDWYHELTRIDQDGRMSCGGKWIVEISELDAFRGRAASQIKQFITCAVDRFRPPYGSVAQSYPRHFVLSGSTNDDSYLHDMTGNRRFWICKCVGKIDLEGLAAAREQLWAEAVSLYKCGSRWWPESQLASDLADIAQTVQIVDPWSDLLERWLAGREWVESRAIYDELGIEPGRRTHHDEQRVRGVMVQMGYCRGWANHGKVRGWRLG